MKCALLGWMAFTDALHQAGIDTTTTDSTSNDSTIIERSSKDES